MKLDYQPLYNIFPELDKIPSGEYDKKVTQLCDILGITRQSLFRYAKIPLDPTVKTPHFIPKDIPFYMVSEMCLFFGVGLNSFYNRPLPFVKPIVHNQLVKTL